MKSILFLVLSFTSLKIWAMDLVDSEWLLTSAQCKNGKNVALKNSSFRLYFKSDDRIEILALTPGTWTLARGQYQIKDQNQLCLILKEIIRSGEETGPADLNWCVQFSPKPNQLVISWSKSETSPADCGDNDPVTVVFKKAQ